MLVCTAHGNRDKRIMAPDNGKQKARHFTDGPLVPMQEWDQFNPMP